MRVAEGTLCRFDSVTEMLAFCRRQYAATAARTSARAGEFVLVVERADPSRFESLIVHFEGEGVYAVLLPGVTAEAPEPGREEPEPAAASTVREAVVELDEEAR